jgi:hypothetical protein
MLTKLQYYRTVDCKEVKSAAEARTSCKILCIRFSLIICLLEPQSANSDSCMYIFLMVVAAQKASGGNEECRGMPQNLLTFNFDYEYVEEPFSPMFLPSDTANSRRLSTGDNRTSQFDQSRECGRIRAIGVYWSGRLFSSSAFKEELPPMADSNMPSGDTWRR